MVQPWLVWLRGLSAACKLKGRQLDSQSGHIPGLLARSPVGGVREATDQWIFLYFPPSLPLSVLKKKKANGTDYRLFSSDSLLKLTNLNSHPVYFLYKTKNLKEDC